jgi:hypothetical protein
LILALFDFLQSSRNLNFIPSIHKIFGEFDSKSSDNIFLLFSPNPRHYLLILPNF